VRNAEENRFLASTSMVRHLARQSKRENRQNDTTKPAFSPERRARGLFGQGEMVYNKNILVYKGRIIMYQKGIKRLLAVVLSACGLLVLSPLLLLLCLAIKLDSPGPIFFRQKRVGIHKSYFNILKFRTMRIDTPHDMPTHLLHDPEQYITRVGRFLRKTSLDELPQLWNILVGDMAVIGPRPALWNQYDLLAERDKYGANDVRPGLTGWAQIHGRDELEITEKAKLDGWYVEHMSFWLDVRCFFGTIKAVADHDGVVEGGTGTLHEEEENDHK
jgi:sugar transferases involved in lipopolysaccharide synthesis